MKTLERRRKFSYSQIGKNCKTFLQYKGTFGGKKREYDKKT